jgi:hypothetical protein
MVSEIHGSVAAFSTEAVASSSVPATSDNIFEEILQKATQENRQNLDTSSGGISSAKQGKAGLEAVLGNQSAAVAQSSTTTASAAADTDTSDTAFVPTFQSDVEVTNSYTCQSTELNPMYFATSETAQYLADKFGTGQIKEEAAYSSGNPYYSTGSLYYIQTPNGQWLNAGLLAETYVRMPESQWPGLADQEIRSAIAQAGG